jgi:inosose dehydratase
VTRGRGLEGRKGHDGAERLRLASAPVTWGVSELTVGRRDLPSPDAVLGAVRGLGFGAVELGPLGYLGDTAGSIRARLDDHGLELAGAFVLLHLADEQGFAGDLPLLERTADLLAAIGPRAPIVLADAGSPERRRASGRPAELGRTALMRGALERAVERLSRAAERCRSRGLSVAFHPHAASYFESEAEVDALLDMTDPELVGLCLDTGHSVVGGIDPLQLARARADRLSHVHLKDVDRDVLGALRAGELGIDRAWDRGLFCPLGEGVVDLEGLLALPELRRFEGWVVLEQDRTDVGAEGLGAVRAVEERNLRRVLEWLGRPHVIEGLHNAERALVPDGGGKA